MLSAILHFASLGRSRGRGFFAAEQIAGRRLNSAIEREELELSIGSAVIGITGDPARQRGLGVFPTANAKELLVLLQRPIVFHASSQAALTETGINRTVQVSGEKS